MTRLIVLLVLTGISQISLAVPNDTVTQSSASASPSSSSSESFASASPSSDSKIVGPAYPKCKPNEVYDPCDASCPGRRCDVDPKTVKCKEPPKLGDADCVAGCRCIDGYARNEAGVCIPREQCPQNQPKCGTNEVYDTCPDCSPQTCETMNQTYHCPLIPANKTGPSCKPSCRCKKGYFRNKIGDCIAASDCQKCTKPHEFFSCGGACDNVCDTIKEQNQTSCPIVNIVCNKMCYCEKDYARDYKNDCIPIKDCPTCPTNERYDPCPANLCTPQTCDEAGFPLNCNQAENGATCPGKPGCVCKDGYLRNKDGVCMPSDKCPSCGGDNNATLGCGVNCNRLCSNLNQTEQSFCTEVCYPNSCDCRTDENGNQYYFDENIKKCVLPQDCTPQCNANEIFSTCVNSGCGAENCADINKPVECTNPEPKDCVSGCKCAPGYLRAENGTCVPSDQCNPPPTCGPNEEFSRCGRDGCLKYYCSDLDLPTLCRDTFQCIPQCECKEGFLRASIDNRTCVPVDQCPRKCKNNELYSECPSASCLPQYCNEAGLPLSCESLGPDGECPGEPGCICESGYLRNDEGICVPKTECPSCGGDENAVSGCGTHCGNTCETYNSTGPKICPLFCNPNGCDCKKNYVYDGNLRKCVLPKKCTPTCKINEVFTTCVQNVGNQDCPQTASAVQSSPIVSKKNCTAGCVCQENFLRAKNGTCVPVDQCPKPQTPKCPAGEILNNCPTPKVCDNEYCPKSSEPQPCISTKQCGTPRCVCGFNSLRDRKTGKCIAASNCPPFPCGPNESFNSCPPVCPGETCLDYLNNSTCSKFPILIAVACKPACRCNKGYYRNDEGVCVAAKTCKEQPSGSSQANPSSPTDTNEPSSPTQNTCDADAQQNALEDGNTAFTGKFFYQVVKNNPEGSVIMSPFSVLTPLGILALYSNGQTNQELLSALNLKTKDDVRCAFPGLEGSIKASNGTELDSGAKLYVYKQGQLSTSLQNDAKTVFNAEAESLDFNNPVDASDIINQWVSNATRGKITQLTSPDMFDSTTRLVIANAIYFKGIWKYKFDASKTSSRDFYVNSNKTIQVPTMQQKGKFKYAELSDPNIQVVELPYVDENLSFLVILPKDNDGLLSVVEKLQDPETLNNIYNNLYQQTVTIYLPKIPKISTKSNLINILQSLGIKTVFDSVNADLSGMLIPDQNLYVSDAIQEATLTVDESGSEASAANAFGVSTLSAVIGEPLEYVFDANHPYAIYININRNITLFCSAFYG